MKSYYENVFSKMTPAMATWLLKIKRSRKGIMWSAVPPRTLGAFYKRKIIMKLSDGTLMLTYTGERVYEAFLAAKKRSKEVQNEQ